MKVRKTDAIPSGLTGTQPEVHTPGAIDRATPLASLPEFLSPEEFRTYLGIGRATCYDLIRRGKIPSLRFGRVIRIPKAALQCLDDPERARQAGDADGHAPSAP